MKSKGQIKHKLKQALYRHLKKRYVSALKRTPENCNYNRSPCEVSPRSPDTRSVPVARRMREDLPRMCIHVERGGFICDNSHVQSVDAKGCLYFTPLKSKEEVKGDFVRLSTSDRALVARSMPDVAALMWVLEQDSGVPEGEVEAAANSAEGQGADPVYAIRTKPTLFKIDVESSGLLTVERPHVKITEDQYAIPTRWWTQVWKSRWNPVQWYKKHRGGRLSEHPEKV